ncbi:MAG: peptidylprolyl isomerase [Pseudomonadota bacterium]
MQKVTLKRLLSHGIAAVSVVISACLFTLPRQADAQDLFETVIKVNDASITRYELEQRALLLELFRAPGDPVRLAREQIIEDSLKVNAAARDGLVLDEDAVDLGVEELAARAGIPSEDFVGALAQAGVDEATVRDFVRAGITWRNYTTARFGPRISVSEDDIERARMSVSGTPGVRVLLAEIILPIDPGQESFVRQQAERISETRSFQQFSSAARQLSASGSAAQGGRLNWLPITQLPAALRPIILALSPGEVSEPLPIQGAIALFQLRDIEELDQPEREYAAIEYAAYYINGGRSEQARARAARVAADVDTCDDLYGIAKGQPPEVLERGSKAPDEIPNDVALELAKLDTGETSANLTRANGQTLVLLMLCGRTAKTEAPPPQRGAETQQAEAQNGEAEEGSEAAAPAGPTPEQISALIRQQRIESFANGLLEQLRSEARIVEK